MVMTEHDYHVYGQKLIPLVARCSMNTYHSQWNLTAVCFFVDKVRFDSDRTYFLPNGNMKK